MSLLGSHGRGSLASSAEALTRPVSTVMKRNKAKHNNKIIFIFKQCERKRKRKTTAFELNNEYYYYVPSGTALTITSSETTLTVSTESTTAEATGLLLTVNGTRTSTGDGLLQGLGDDVLGKVQESTQVLDTGVEQVPVIPLPAPRNKEIAWI